MLRYDDILTLVNGYLQKLILQNIKLFIRILGIISCFGGRFHRRSNHTWTRNRLLAYLGLPFFAREESFLMTSSLLMQPIAKVIPCSAATRAHHCRFCYGNMSLITP
uniref:Uncharacterized protein n=1 Tax=Opuntia streptacantha TaxID=393608 RepID=A0A7C9A2V1_OPUST